MGDSFLCATDETDVECPACNESNNLQDLRTDDCLNPGMDWKCDHCGATLVIDVVDWEPTIWCSVKEPAAPPSETVDPVTKGGDGG